jgi:phosphoribosylformylglycinamidine synthase PurS subunit
MAFLARIYVTPRADVLDPQGAAVTHGLHSLGFSEVDGVRIGRYLEVTLDGSDRAAAEARVTSMCQRLLANTVVEDFRFELDAVGNDR